MASEDSASVLTNLSATEVLEGVTDYVMLLDHNWTIIYLNAEARRLLASEVQLVGRSLWDLFHKSDQTHIRETMDRALERGEGTRFQFYGPDLESWFDLSFRPITDDIVAISFHDISGQRWASAQVSLLEHHAEGDARGAEPTKHIYITGLSEQISMLADRISQVACGLPLASNANTDRRRSDRELARIAEGLYRDRQLRKAAFPELELGEPQWDILLDLFVEAVAGRGVSVTSACIASDVPGSTALRAIGMLAERGFVERKPDDVDKRRIWLDLTDFGKRAVGDYLIQVECARRQ